MEQLGLATQHTRPCVRDVQISATKTCLNAMTGLLFSVYSPSLHHKEVITPIMEKYKRETIHYKFIIHPKQLWATTDFNIALQNTAPNFFFLFNV